MSRARTDYVYTVVAADGDTWKHGKPVRRTLKGAKDEAKYGLWRPTVTKTGPHTWRVVSGGGTGNASIITRSPLVN